MSESEVRIEGGCGSPQGLCVCTKPAGHGDRHACRHGYWRNGGEFRLEVSSEQVHRDALADTGDAYRQFHGWVLECLWCEFEAVGKSKAEALRNMQRHYDAVLPGCELR